MLVHAYDPSTWEAETEGSQVRGQPQQVVRLCFKIKIKNKPGVVVHTCNPSSWEAETGGSQV